ncbi:tetratricopeptide repeat protein [Streptomyces xanthophaeus]
MRQRPVRIGAWLSGTVTALTALAALLTNYVTDDVPAWAKDSHIDTALLAALIALTIALTLWSQRLGNTGTAAPGPGRLVPVDRITAAAAAGSLTPPRLRTALRGRHTELTALRKLLNRPKGRFAVVSGTGGVGKTTLAAALAEHATNRKHAVFWITWRGPEQFAEDMLRVAVACGLPEETVEAARAGRAPLTDLVWGQLGGRGKWLIVLDNLDNPARLGPDGSGPVGDYRGWIRPTGGGLLLVTTRDSHSDTWGPDAAHSRLQPLEDQPGADLLLDLAPAAGTRDEAEHLARRLGGLPLALQTAGRYLAAPGSRHRTFTTYTTALDTELGNLLAAEHPNASNPDTDTARTLVRYTWELSLDQLERDGNHLARPVLRLLALMAQAPVPLTLLTPELLQDATGQTTDPVHIEAAVNGLHAYGLLHTPTSEPADTVPGQVALHPLVREITAHTHTQEAAGTTPWHTALAHQLARTITATRSAGRSSWPLAALLVPHALALTAVPASDRALGRGLNQLATIQDAAGQAADALLLNEANLDRALRLFGANHLDTLTSRNNLALALHALGHHQEAADHHTTNLDACTLALGPDDPHTLTSRNNLAHTLNALGHHQEAADHHAHVLNACTLALGPDHPDTLTSRNNLALALHDLGRHQEAADHHAHVFDAFTRTLGPDHTNTLTSRNNLANALNALGHHQEAADHHTANHADLERILGPDHPITLASRNYLAGALHDLGHHQEAADHYTHVLADRERILGPDHPHTLTSRNNLALTQQQLQARAQPGRRWWQRVGRTPR